MKSFEEFYMDESYLTEMPHVGGFRIIDDDPSTEISYDFHVEKRLDSGINWPEDLKQELERITKVIEKHKNNDLKNISDIDERKSIIQKYEDRFDYVMNRFFENCVFVDGIGLPGQPMMFISQFFKLPKDIQIDLIKAIPPKIITKLNQTITELDMVGRSKIQPDDSF